MRRLLKKSLSKKSVSVLLVASLLIGVGSLFVGQASGAQITQRSITLSDNRPGATSIYTMSVYLPSSGTLGAFKIEFCGNTALFEVSCVAPAGFDASHAQLLEESGQTAFTIDTSASDSHTLILTRPPAGSIPGTTVFTFSGIINPTAQDSFFARISTYDGNDTTVPWIDKGSVAMATTQYLNVAGEVPPYLDFCVGDSISGNDCKTAQGNFVDLGTLSTARAAYGQTQMMGATNAQYGYNVRVTGSTLASGNNIIAPLQTPTPSAPGTSQFGINLRANNEPPMGSDPSGPGVGSVASGYAQTNRYQYINGDVIASTPGPDDYRKYTANYLVNVGSAQPSGIYNSTFTYICLANF